jgi:hypothetical protein
LLDLRQVIHANLARLFGFCLRGHLCFHDNGEPRREAIRSIAVLSRWRRTPGMTPPLRSE